MELLKAAGAPTNGHPPLQVEIVCDDRNVLAKWNSPTAHGDWLLTTAPAGDSSTAPGAGRHHPGCLQRLGAAAGDSLSGAGAVQCRGARSPDRRETGRRLSAAADPGDGHCGVVAEGTGRPGAGRRRSPLLRHALRQERVVIVEELAALSRT